jgi:hypothetical protein
MGEARRKRRRTYDEMMECREKVPETSSGIESLMAGQADPSSAQGLNVFPTMEAAWQDFVDHWVHVGLPDRYRDEALRLAFYVGVQSAANLMRYCQGHGEFNLASDQIQEEEVSYYQSEVKPKVDIAKADEWRTGEI